MKTVTLYTILLMMIEEDIAARLSRVFVLKL